MAGKAIKRPCIWLSWKESHRSLDGCAHALWVFALVHKSRAEKDEHSCKALSAKAMLVVYPTPHSCSTISVLSGLSACLLPPGVVGVELPERQQAALVLLIRIHDVVPVLRSQDVGCSI